jgi:hypothetical protein
MTSAEKKAIYAALAKGPVRQPLSRRPSSPLRPRPCGVDRLGREVHLDQAAGSIGERYRVPAGPWRRPSKGLARRASSHSEPRAPRPARFRTP